MYKIIECNCDLKQLNKFSQKFAQKAAVGDIIFLKGELGVGKTTFARFFIKSLSIHNKKKEPKVVVSPTYSLIQNYDCGKEKTVCHIDLYRLKSIKEIQVIDFFEEIRDKITLIEWPEKVEKIFKEKIEINFINNLTRLESRIITVRAFGNNYKNKLSSLKLNKKK